MSQEAVHAFESGLQFSVSSQEGEEGGKVKDSIGRGQSSFISVGRSLGTEPHLRSSSKRLSKQSVFCVLCCVIREYSAQKWQKWVQIEYSEVKCKGNIQSWPSLGIKRDRLLLQNRLPRGEANTGENQSSACVPNGEQAVSTLTPHPFFSLPLIDTGL